MDPNTTLDNIRALAGLIISADLGGMTYDLADAVQGLDDWITHGGFLPSAWEKEA